MLSLFATKGRSGEWLDEHPIAALAVVVACIAIAGWLA